MGASKESKNLKANLEHWKDFMSEMFEFFVYFSWRNSNMKREHFLLVVNHNYGTGKGNCYEKVNGFMKEKQENVIFSKFVK